MAEVADLTRQSVGQRLAELTQPLRQTQDDKDTHSKPIVVVGGGVSGIYAALTLAERGYTNITVIEKELRVGGKAASFEYNGQKFPLGAVGTSLALDSASFAEQQLFEKPGKFLASLLGRTGRRLQVLNANNLVPNSAARWPVPFPAQELTSTTPVSDWQRAFGAKGRPERFYPHAIDFASPAARPHTAALAAAPLPSLVPRWGQPRTSWPLVYVSAHGYGVAQAADAPPLYYWVRFAQKSTNANLGMMGPLRYGPIGPRGPALRGWDSTSLFEDRLQRVGVVRVSLHTHTPRLCASPRALQTQHQVVCAARRSACAQVCRLCPFRAALPRCVCTQRTVLSRPSTSLCSLPT